MKVWRSSQMAKAMVCKTIIRGFDSHLRLNLNYFAAVLESGLQERLKIVWDFSHVGSSPTRGTYGGKIYKADKLELFQYMEPKYGLCSWIF